MGKDNCQKNKRVMHLKNKIRSQDMYGHPVKLNFAESGENHKTLIGGSFSLIVNLFIWLFVAYHLKKLLWKE